jgi:protein involved in polysaccharide export with SLBB domain
MKKLIYLYAAVILIFWCFPELTIKNIFSPGELAQAEEQTPASRIEQSVNQEIQNVPEVPTTNTDSQIPVDPPPSDSNAIPDNVVSIPPIEEVKPALNAPPSPPNQSEHIAAAKLSDKEMKSQYTVGPEDVLQVQTIQPEQLSINATVSPDGFISFPYIGNIKVKDKTLTEIQEEITKYLADGYMKYPIVVVTLQESKSRKFFVYGEVNKPGTYPLEEQTTVLRAISMAGGFTKYGSSSRVKILKSQAKGPGYETVKVDIGQVMEGNAHEDPVLSSGDIVVVSEGIF